jgi:uncharacterized membrane-anchored protein
VTTTATAALGDAIFVSIIDGTVFRVSFTLSVTNIALLKLTTRLRDPSGAAVSRIDARCLCSSRPWRPGRSRIAGTFRCQRSSDVRIAVVDRGVGIPNL